jgi:trehalose-6-phosphate synthase
LPRLVIVSNRVAIPDRTGKQVAGGLAVALREAFKGHQGLWFGWSGKVAAQATSRPRMVEGGALQYALMDLTPLDRREYYNGFANRALWPTMHYRVGLSDFARAAKPSATRTISDATSTRNSVPTESLHQPQRETDTTLESRVFRLVST